MLKTLGSALLITLCLALTAPLAAHDWDRQAETAISRVVRISMVTNSKSPGGMCSSWVWDQEKGLAVTAGHCAFNLAYGRPSPLEVIYDTDEGPVTYPVALVAVNSTLDIALIQSEGFKLTPAMERGRSQKVGKQVLAVGHTQWGVPYVKSGIVVVVRDVDQRVVHDAVYAHGMSGGVLIDSHTQVIGLLISTAYVYGTGTAVRIEDIESFVSGMLGLEINKELR